MRTAEYEVIRTDGSRERQSVPRSHLLQKIYQSIGCDCGDVVNLRDGRVMIVDDIGHKKGKPVNPEATNLYHGVCRPGTTHQIVGDVAIATDADFA